MRKIHFFFKNRRKQRRGEAEIFATFNELIFSYKAEVNFNQ